MSSAQVGNAGEHFAMACLLARGICLKEQINEMS